MNANTNPDMAKAADAIVALAETLARYRKALIDGGFDEKIAQELTFDMHKRVMNHAFSGVVPPAGEVPVTAKTDRG